MELLLEEECFNEGIALEEELLDILLLLLLSVVLFDELVVVELGLYSDLLLLVLLLDDVNGFSNFFMELVSTVETRDVSEVGRCLFSVLISMVFVLDTPTFGLLLRTSEVRVHVSC